MITVHFSGVCEASWLSIIFGILWGLSASAFALFGHQTQVEQRLPDVISWPLNYMRFSNRTANALIGPAVFWGGLFLAVARTCCDGYVPWLPHFQDDFGLQWSAMLPVLTAIGAAIGYRIVYKEKPVLRVAFMTYGAASGFATAQISVAHTQAQSIQWIVAAVSITYAAQTARMLTRRIDKDRKSVDAAA